MNRTFRPLLQHSRLLLRPALAIRSLSSSSSSSSSPTKQPPTYYQLFPTTLPYGPPPRGSFDLDPRALRQEFFKLQQLTHPDVISDPSLKRRAEAGSAYLNHAYSTLLSPLLRAQYILRLRGVDVEDETMRLDDEGLLMEVLAAREEIEETETETGLVPLRTVNDARIGESLRRLERAFAEDDLGMAKAETVKLRYWVNIRESLDAWEKGKPVVLVH
ncbi:molecular chaperone [Maublancomyces gigas]|uniref:Molecular chaperone n=1 Tax=Discina gigas TaxID=1032678 RepID=A0ABR3GX02_9PEZI